MKNLKLVTLLILSVSVCGFAQKKSKAEEPMFVLSSIVYDEPQADIGYYYQTYIERMMATDELNSPISPGVNRVDSIKFDYNDQNSLSKITIFRKNTTETNEIIYNSNGKIIQCIEKSSKKDMYNPDAVTTFVHSGNKIEMTNEQNSDTYKSELILDKKGRLLSCDGESFTDLYKYDKYSNLEKIERTGKMPPSKTIVPFEYNLPKITVYNYGNTPQWFCLVQPNMWTLGSHLKGFQKVDEFNNLVQVSVISYTSDYDGNPQKITERILRKGKEPYDVSYQLRYTRVK